MRGNGQRGAPLGIWMCTALVVGNMVGSGVFLLPASLGPYGAWSIAGWLITGGGSLLLAFVYAMWAIAGSGRDTVYWGVLLLGAGLPVYAWRTHGRETRTA